MPNSLNFRRELRAVLLVQAVVKKKKSFLKYPKYSVYRAAIQTRSSPGLTKERGTLQSWSLFQNRRNSLASDKEFTLFCNSWIWVRSWLTVVGSLFWCDRQFINSCLSCWICFFCSKFFAILQFLGNILRDFLGKSPFFTSNYPHKFIFSLWAWSAHWFACCSSNRWDSSSWWVSKRAISEYLFSQFLIISASASDNLSWADLSPERLIQLSVPGTYGHCVCLSAFAQRSNLDLSSLSTQILQHSQQFRGPLPRSWCQIMSLQQNRNPLPVSWCYKNPISTRLEKCYRVPAAARSWMLREVECWGRSKSSEAAIVASFSRLKLLFLDGRLVGVSSLLTSMQNLGS